MSFRFLAAVAATLFLAGCANTEEPIHDTHYGPPTFINGFDTRGYSPAPFGSFSPTGNTTNQAPDLGHFSGSALPDGWKGFTGD